jgi:hypothetical protein
MEAVNYKTLREISLEVEVIAKEISQKLARFDKDVIHIFYAENILSLPQDVKENIVKDSSGQYSKFIKSILQKEAKATVQQKEKAKNLREIIIDGNKKIREAYNALSFTDESALTASIEKIPNTSVDFPGGENFPTPAENNSNKNVVESSSKKPPRRFFVD